MDYERGLKQLRQYLCDTDLEEDYLIYEARLRENLQTERLYGTSEQQRADRAQIVYQLNRLAQQVNTNFIDLCLEGNTLSSAPSANTSNKHNSSQTAPDVTILTYDIHTEWIGTVEWSPDGERIASAGGDGVIRIWEASSERNLVTYRGHADGPLSRIFTKIWQASWSPDGQYIASSGSGPTVRIWEASTGKDILLYHGHAAIDPLLDTFALDWSPDGTRIVSACSFRYTDHTVHIWNAATGSILLKYAGYKVNNIIKGSFSVTNLAWSPNGQHIASSGSDKNVKKWQPDPTTTNTSIQVWNPNTGQHILTCEGISTWFYDVAWSPDNKYIAAAGSNKEVGIWDATTGKNVFTYTGHTKEVRAVGWSPDGSLIASAGNDNTVQLWRPFTGELLFVYRKHTDNVTTLAWSPEGKRIASAGVDKTVRIWQAV
jgi:WD40 repeat protein